MLRGDFERPALERPGPRADGEMDYYVFAHGNSPSGRQQIQDNTDDRAVAHDAYEIEVSIEVPWVIKRRGFCLFRQPLMKQQLPGVVNREF